MFAQPEMTLRPARPRPRFVRLLTVGTIEQSSLSIREWRLLSSGAQAEVLQDVALVAQQRLLHEQADRIIGHLELWETLDLATDPDNRSQDFALWFVVAEPRVRGLTDALIRDAWDRGYRQIAVLSEAEWPSS